MARHTTVADTTVENVMPNHPKPATDAPFDLDSLRYLLADSDPVPIIRRSRRTRPNKVTATSTTTLRDFNQAIPKAAGRDDPEVA